MTSKRFEITCPHCHRSYALRVDPDNLDNASATARCGRCKKRFRLSAAVAASVEKTEMSPSEPIRNAYRKRISRPAMRQFADVQKSTSAPGAVVDEIALAFERALQERRRNRDAGLTATEIELPLEEDDVFDGPLGAASVAARLEPAPPATKRHITPRVAVRFTPPPARDILFGSNLGALDDTSPPSEPLPDELRATPVLEGSLAEIVARRLTPVPTPVSDRQSEPRSRSSRPPRPRESLKAPIIVEPVNRNASREAWLALADEPLENLVCNTSASVAALEWLLAEDALRDV